MEESNLASGVHPSFGRTMRIYTPRAAGFCTSRSLAPAHSFLSSTRPIPPALFSIHKRYNDLIAIFMIRLPRCAFDTAKCLGGNQIVELASFSPHRMEFAGVCPRLDRTRSPSCDQNRGRCRPSHSCARGDFQYDAASGQRRHIVGGHLKLRSTHTRRALISVSR